MLPSFTSLLRNCCAGKIFSLLSNPRAPPGWKSCFQQDKDWDVFGPDPGYPSLQPPHPQLGILVLDSCDKLKSP